LIGLSAERATLRFEDPNEEFIANYQAVEERCQHLEQTINSTTSLLRVVIADYGSPCLKPILGSVIERVNSITVFLETALDVTPPPNNYESL
jgi:hypothetical protein